MTIHLSLSGGLDSTVLLTTALTEDEPVVAWSFDYGQRHVWELVAARDIIRHLDVPWRTLNLKGLLHGGALVDNAPLPEGHYTAETMEATVVNGRNLLFAASIIAQTQPGDQMWMGVHAGDHAIYADCRPEFVNGVEQAAEAYDVTVKAPFVHMTKAEIVAQGHDLNAPMDLSWSCYAGAHDGARHCGRCGTCVERAEAFHLAGVPDPTSYADSEFWRTVCNVS